MSFGHRRRGRGYAFEKTIVKYFEDRWKDDWHARRLGGSSTGLPDVVVTNNKKNILFSIEAKAATRHGAAYIDSDQILRCQIVLNVFGVYRRKNIVFAFKFAKNKEEGRDKLRYYFFKVVSVKSLNHIEWVKCFYDGRLRYKLVSAGDEIVAAEKITAELKVIKYDSLHKLKENIIDPKPKKEVIVSKDV